MAFALRDSFEVAKSLGIKIPRTKICGGGAKSLLWKQMIANILNIPVDVIETNEGPSMGAVMLAAVGCGEYKSVREASEAIVRVVDSYEPRRETALKYNDRYNEFRQIYPALKGVFGSIS